MYLEIIQSRQERIRRIQALREEIERFLVKSAESQERDRQQVKRNEQVTTHKRSDL